MLLLDLIKRFKKGILIALLLVVVEDVAWIIEPYLFGNVIDAVIDVQVSKQYEKDSLEYSSKIKTFDYVEGTDSLDVESDTTYTEEIDSLITNPPERNEYIIHDSYIFPLFLWALFFIINSTVGAIRRFVDPRIFLNIYTKIATEVSEYSIKHKLSISKTAARAELSRQYIDFLEFRFPEVIENVISIAGAIIALYFFDYLISAACLIIIIPLYLANKLYTTKVMRLQKIYHDNYEDMFDVFAKRNPEYVKRYYTKLALPQKKIADWGALNFGIMRFTLLVVFMMVLYIAIDLDEFSAGELYSIVAYLWTFVTATEFLPELLESWTSLKDISTRLKQEK